ncbi:hypothetical protein [Falsarthrobacter nasiphocae]|uniref:Mannitol-specific phosphotransferase system IIBC component n=1 Tax=Falsarthrobacter nasiphocae TaxID=189863 RepID=A0AAE3YEQ5_9MICC|nr:hypothetical protein [Falsarthrobacter nasiphocae]MDR6891840.1 mannitol-specific phosphotransferase system IIBC component [Falsarthrobacter nasiphocae]
MEENLLGAMSPRPRKSLIWLVSFVAFVAVTLVSLASTPGGLSLLLNSTKAIAFVLTLGVATSTALTFIVGSVIRSKRRRKES